MDNVIFEFYIGNTFSKDFTLSGYQEEIDEVYFTVKKADDDKKFVLQKTLDNGITLVDVEYEPDGTTILSRTYNILINAGDTENLKVETEYPFDVKIITSESPSDIKETVIKGNVILKSAVTRAYNE